MAIAFDAATDGGHNGGSSSSRTFSHTCSGSDRVLLVGLLGDNISDLITGCTYNGVAMTLLGKCGFADGSGFVRWTYLFALLAPATGANNVVTTSSGNCYHIPVAVSYTGHSQAMLPLFPEAINTQAGPGTSTSITRTVVAPCANSWAVMLFSSYDSGAATTIGAGATSRIVGTLSTPEIVDSNGTAIVAGTRHSMTLSHPVNARQWETIAAALIPVGGVPKARLVLAESLDGFGGDLTQFGRKWVRNSTTLWTGHPQAGSYGAGNASATHAARAVAIFGSAVIVGFPYYWNGSSIPGGVNDLFLFSAYGTGFDGFNAVCALDNDSSGQLMVCRGGNRGTVLATSAPCLNANANNFIQFYYDVRDAGSWVVQCNSVTVLTGSGDLAPNASPATLASINIGTSNGIGWDSLYIFDRVTSSADLLTDSAPTVSMFRPLADSVAAGSLATLTPSTGTDHGALVDDAIANDDTDYNSGAAGVGDAYVFDLSSLAGKTIHGIALTIVAKATTGGTNTIAGIARIGGTTYAGATQAITTSYAYYEELFTLNPATGLAWVAGSLEFGVLSIASAGANRVTSVYLEVLHDGTATITGAVRLVGSMRIKTRLTGGVLA